MAKHNTKRDGASIPEATERPVLIVWMEDELVHTDQHPQCADPTCPCWLEEAGVTVSLVTREPLEDEEV